MPPIDADTQLDSVGGCDVKYGLMSGNPANVPMAARSPGSKCRTNSSTPRRIKKRFSIMLPLISSMMAAANGTGSLRNTAMGLASQLSFTSKSACVRSVTSVPSFCITVAMT